MPKEYRLLFDDDVYWEMAQRSYDAPRWMNMDSVPAKAMELRRSEKKLEELCRKGAILTDDILTIRQRCKNGGTVSFSATVGLIVLGSVI